MILLPGGSNMVATNGGMTLFPISEGDPIDASLNWEAGANTFGGGFSEDTPYYFGLSFDIGGSTHYGWVLTSFNQSGDFGEVTLWSFAYDDEAGASITATAVPEPSDVSALAGLLAGSAVAMGARRRRKAAKAA